MTLSEIKELKEMGFSNEQILTLSSGKPEPVQEPAQEPEQEQQVENSDHQNQPEPVENQQPNPEIESLKSQITETQKQLTALVKQMQNNNLKTASVQIAPDDDLMRKTDEAMSELIRPKIKEV